MNAITGFTFTSLLNLEARGVAAQDVVVMPYPAYGVKLYGNAVIASPKILKENRAAVKAFLQSFAKGVKDVIANPAAAIEDVKARDGIVNVELETRHLKLAIDTVINSPNARAEGFGYLLISAGSSMQMGLAFAGLLVVGAMAMYELFSAIENHTMGWAHQGSQNT